MVDGVMDERVALGVSGEVRREGSGRRGVERAAGPREVESMGEDGVYDLQFGGHCGC